MQITLLILGFLALAILGVPLWRIMLSLPARAPQMIEAPREDFEHSSHPPPVPIPNDFNIARVYRIQESIVPPHLHGFLRDPTDSAFLPEWEAFRALHLDQRDWIPGIFVREHSSAWRNAVETPGLALMSSSGRFTPSAKGLI